LSNLLEGGADSVWARIPKMAVWRRRALELFPQLRRDVNGRDRYSIYMLYFDLLPMLRDAFDSGDDELVRRVFTFAEWCSRQAAEDLWNAAGVAFYEHLFDRPEYSERVIAWLSPCVVFDHWSLWEAQVAPAEWDRVRPLLED